LEVGSCGFRLQPERPDVESYIVLASELQWDDGL
jgi:hypothetical protein